MNKFLATFLITYYATQPSLSGLFGSLDKFRAIMQVSKTTADIVGCPFCFSIYAALLVHFLPDWLTAIIASAGAVCLAFIGKKTLDEIKESATWINYLMDLIYGD